MSKKPLHLTDDCNTLHLVASWLKTTPRDDAKDWSDMIDAAIDQAALIGARLMQEASARATHAVAMRHVVGGVHEICVADYQEAVRAINVAEIIKQGE